MVTNQIAQNGIIIQSRQRMKRVLAGGGLKRKIIKVEEFHKK